MPSLLPQAAQHKFSGGAPGVAPDFLLLDSRNGNVVHVASEVPLARTVANSQGLKVAHFLLELAQRPPCDTCETESG